jgi:hypothetical protein
MRNRREFPTPSDIIGIIEGRKKMDAGVYISLTKSRDEGQFLTNEEHNYISNYENQIIQGLK